MTMPQLTVATPALPSLERSPSWWDSDSECTMVLAEPSAEPELWDEYVRGAQLSYRKYGVEAALDMADLRRPADTALFCVGVNAAGNVVGGLRAKGPYRSADESHAMVEWAGQPGLETVRKMITDRLPFGVVEMKTAWATDDPEKRRALTTTLSRSAFPTMVFLDVQFLMATAAGHVLDQWRSSGGVVASKIPASPYPDERYRTKMMWWDRSTFINHAEPKQLSKMLSEMTQLQAALDRRGGRFASSGSGV